MGEPLGEVVLPDPSNMGVCPRCGSIEEMKDVVRFLYPWQTCPHCGTVIQELCVDCFTYLERQVIS